MVKGGATRGQGGGGFNFIDTKLDSTTYLLTTDTRKQIQQSVHTDYFTTQMGGQLLVGTLWTDFVLQSSLGSEPKGRSTCLKGRSLFMISSASVLFFVAGRILQLHSATTTTTNICWMGCLLWLWLWPTHVRCKNFMLNATSPHPSVLLFYYYKCCFSNVSSTNFDILLEEIIKFFMCHKY